MKVYICGPMTDIPEYNRLAFEKAERDLELAGFVPVSPIRIHGEPWPECAEAKTRAEIMVTCIEALLECGGITLLPGWQDSSGASVEAAVAAAIHLKLIHTDAATVVRLPITL